ncbi:MAG: molybdenum cofactor biosynthesis protein MoaE [Pseudomonadota bacterium]
MIDLLSDDFDPAARLSAFTASVDGAGAIASFVGLVRDQSADARVRRLRLDYHPTLTRASIEAAAQAAARRWGLRDILVLHRVGDVQAGAPIVLAATAADHRRAAFEACDHLMDYLKTQAPFWKLEITDQGERWIEPRAQDYKDAARWRA